MSNAKVYRKTLPFSFLMFVIDLGVLGVIIGLATAGYFIAKDNVSWHAFVGLGIGLVVGIIISVIVTYLVQNRFKAAQIAMMTRGVTTGDLPDHIVHEGLAELKGRFGKITL